MILSIDFSQIIYKFACFFSFSGHGKEKMYMKSRNEYFAKSKGVLLYDKHFNLSRWKTRWKVWKI